MPDQFTIGDSFLEKDADMYRHGIHVQGHGNFIEVNGSSEMRDYICKLLNEHPPTFEVKSINHSNDLVGQAEDEKLKAELE